MKKIERKKIIERHNPILNEISTYSPLSVGNGDFCFTADITGFQTFSSFYEEHSFPLCTMSSWGWHTIPFSPETYAPSRSALQLTTYESKKGRKDYAVKKFYGNEKVYDWFRENPHKINLGNIALKDNGQDISPNNIRGIRQELHLYTGELVSTFVYKNTFFSVKTVCDSHTDTVSFSLSAFDVADEKTQQAIEKEIPDFLSIEITFPYGSPKKEAADWNAPQKHKTWTKVINSKTVKINRVLDKDSYTVMIWASEVDFMAKDEVHCLSLIPVNRTKTIECSFRFVSSKEETQLVPSFSSSKDHSVQFFENYWETGGIIDFSKSSDSRWLELERRVILSQYLLIIQSCGSAPPQETGLSCNSWYGKFHLEMYPLHTAWLALWNHTDILKRSLPWFIEHLNDAKENAAKNGYKGARWPKMVGPDAVDSPSPIATLLVWQQSHILYLLELVYRNGKDRDLLLQYRDCVFETATFMADFSNFDEFSKTWNIESPVIPVQEVYNPEDVRNPSFEIEYWRWGFQTAIFWLERLGEKAPEKWKVIADTMAPMAFHDGLYSAHENCNNTFTEYNKDHPSMLMSYGFIPNDRIDFEMMERTLEKVISCWNYDSLWGWDFAILALTAQRLGKKNLAIDLLLTDTLKNTYVESGNNRQVTRSDLPLYLPGNGSLLLAVAHLAATGAFSQGNWSILYENIMPLFE